MVNKEMEIKCSFCGRPESLVKQMVAGPNNLFICDECINSCYDMLKGKSEASRRFRSAHATRHKGQTRRIYRRPKRSKKGFERRRVQSLQKGDVQRKKQR